MRHALIGICIFTAACSGQPFSSTSPSGAASAQPFSPTSPSGVAGVGAQGQASGGAPAEVTFTKWGTGIPVPTHVGFAGGDVPGTFAGTVLSRDAFENGTIVQLEAQYEVTGADSAHSFVARIDGTLNNETRKAVLNGTVTAGWLVGAQVQVTFDVIVPATGTSCVSGAPVNRTCFQGTIRIMRGSAS